MKINDTNIFYYAKKKVFERHLYVVKKRKGESEEKNR